jgi:Xaa-Pro dipeptidase
MTTSTLRRLSKARYPSFSEAEMARRWTCLRAVAEERGLRRLLVYESNRHGSAVQWLTGWPVTREAALLWGVDDDPLLLVQFYNHVPLARELAHGVKVDWAGVSTIRRILDELDARPAGGGPLGVTGSLPFTAYQTLVDHGVQVVDVNPAYTELRLCKSAEELDWIRAGCELTDAGLAALEAGLRPGLTEHDLADLVERAYVPLGGTTYIHYFGVSSMRQPSRGVPAQFTSGRRVAAGDVVVLELSAAFWGYAGQGLRTFVLADAPEPLYGELHAVADEAFERVLSVLRDGTTAEEIIEAASVIEDAGFTTCDDLVHGFGGGYLPPVIASRSRAPATAASAPAVRTGMTLVVQPNVITQDGRAGVQTGELVAIEDHGVQRLHSAATGLRLVHPTEG